MDPTPFERWYAANCMYGRVVGKTAMHSAWCAAIDAAAKACSQVGQRTVTSGGSEAADACRERVEGLK